MGRFQNNSFPAGNHYFVRRMKEGHYMEKVGCPKAILVLFLFMVGYSQWGQSQEALPNRISFMLGEPPVTISLPCSVTPMESSVPMDKINSIQRFDTYRLYHADGKVVAIFKFIQFNIPIVESIQDLMEGESKGVLNMIKATPREQQIGAIQLGELDGLQVKGSFTLNDHTWTYEDVVFVHNNAMWQIWVAADQSDPSYRQELKTILASLQFKQ